MSSLDRPLAGDAMLFHLRDEEITAEQHAAHPDKTTARTLLKEGTLRVTLVVVPAGGGIPEHEADGPITVQPITGTVVFKTQGGTFTLGQGDLLALNKGVKHQVSSEQGATFVLTVVHT